MKTNLKNGLLMAAILALVSLSVPQSQAQVPTSGWQSFNWGVSGVISNAASSATNFNSVIDCGKQASVGVYLAAQFNQAGSTNTAVWFLTRSGDGVTYENTGQNVGLTQSGTSLVSIWTNIPSQGANYIKINYLTNNAATANITNVSGGYAIKISAP